MDNTSTELLEQKKIIPSESCHWYDSKTGAPRYSVIGKNGKERATTIKDARENDWLPSVTNILNVAAKPGLQKWKLQQMLHAALTLPRIEGETDDVFADRVIEDSEAQSKKAADKGTQLHAAIEDWIRTGYFDISWENHIMEVRDVLSQHGIDLKQGSAEHSFASPLGYGGKIDFHQDAEFEDHEGGNHQISDPLIIDFKTKEKIDDKKQLAWPEHIQQLAAYGYGLWLDTATLSGPPVKQFRALNVFIGCADREVRVIEHSWEDILDGWEQFKLLLEYWMRAKKFGKYTNSH